MAMYELVRFGMEPLFYAFGYYIIVNIIILIVTAEKWFAVSRPFAAHLKFKHSKKTSTIFVIFALVFCFVINSHFLITHSIINFNYGLYKRESDYYDYGLNENKTLNESSDIVLICTHTKWNIFYDSYWGFIDATIYSFLPCTFLCMFNFSILRYLFKAETENSKLTPYRQKPLITRFVKLKLKRISQISINDSSQKFDEVEESTKIKYIKASETNRSSIIFTKSEKLNGKSSSVDSQIKTFNYRKQSMKLINKRLTIMILLISISFCALSMPMVILQIIQLYNRKMYNKNNLNFDLLTAIAELLQYLNHSTNFLVYCLSGKTFRQETKNCLRSYLNSLIKLKNNLKKKIFK